MKKWALFVMVAALLAMPALACGFPFPAGSSMVSVSKAVCAEDEAAESCQQRQDAYQIMGKLQAAQVTNMSMSVFIDDGTSTTEMAAEGMFDYVVTDTADGLGANIHATLSAGTINTGDGNQSLEDVEFIVLDGVGYTYDNGEWTYSELDESTLLGLGMLLGLTGPAGIGFDLYSEPGAFTVETGPETDINGQRMHVQTLTLNLEALMRDSDALENLLVASGDGAAMVGVDMSEIGSPGDLAMMAVLLIPAFEGSTFSTTIYIGADDGYIHRIEENYVFRMDTAAVGFGDPGDAQKMELTYSLVGDVSGHNEPLVIAAPSDATEGEGLLEGSGGGLGNSLFGN